MHDLVLWTGIPSFRQFELLFVEVEGIAGMSLEVRMASSFFLGLVEMVLIGMIVVILGKKGFRLKLDLKSIMKVV